MQWDTPVSPYALARVIARRTRARVHRDRVSPAELLIDPRDDVAFAVDDPAAEAG